MATVAANALFASITGSSIASATVFTRIAVPEMLKFGYTRQFSVGVVAGSSVLGMLIPPSAMLIIYAIVAEQSVGEMFIAGFIPGILLATAFEPLALPYVIPLCVAGLSLVLSGTTGRQAVWRVACSAPPSCCRRSPGCGPRSAWEPGSHSASSRVCGSLLWGGD